MFSKHSYPSKKASSRQAQYGITVLEGKMTENKEPTDSRGADLTVTVVNENNGKTEVFHAGPGTPGQTIIGRMYESPKLGINRARVPEDRLRCKDDGEDIFQYSGLKLGELQEKHCKSLQWRFAGPTGGA